MLGCQTYVYTFCESETASRVFVVKYDGIRNWFSGCFREDRYLNFSMIRNAVYRRFKWIPKSGLFCHSDDFFSLQLRVAGGAVVSGVDWISLRFLCLRKSKYRIVVSSIDDFRIRFGWSHWQQHLFCWQMPDLFRFFSYAKAML